jgi:CTP:molybdopterin cytidylyltransferase MocA
VSRIAAVVLAAGEGSRFGGPKQLVTLPEVLSRLAASRIVDTVVVEGAHPLGLAAGTARLVVCRDWSRGPGASLRAGLAALDDTVEAALVVLADGPDLASDAVAHVIESWEREGGDVVAASYANQRSHPVVVARSAWSTIPDEGLRDLPARLVPCDAFGAPGDVDTPADLPARLRATEP